MATKDTKTGDDLSPEEKAALSQAKASHGVSEEELANLSDSEREALEEQDTDESSLREIAAEGEGEGEGDKGKEKEKDAKAEKDEKDEEEEEEADEKGEKDEKDEKAAVGDAEPDLEIPKRLKLPRVEVKPVEKYDEQMAALDTEYDSVMATYKEGDMGIDELLKQQRALDNKRFDLRIAKDRADSAAETNRQAGQSEWMADVDAFFQVVKGKEGIDYTKRSLNVAFDLALKELADDKANKDKSEAWFLNQAHRMVKADIGLKPTAKKQGGEKGAKKGRAPGTAELNDIGGLPSAGDGDGDDDAADSEFSALDRLNGQEFEDALARMPAAKQDKYLRQ